MYETLIMSICVQALKDKVRVVCKNMKPCVNVGASVGHRE